MNKSLGMQTDCIRYSNNAVRSHISTTRGLFPHKRILRKSEITSKGLVVTEHEEDVSGLPVSSGSGSGHALEDTSTPRKSPIAELLYMRWLEGLKLKWPSIL